MLIELVEACYQDWNGDAQLRTYEVYEGVWYSVYSNSGNAYWHTKEAYEADPMLGSYSVSDTRYIMVLSDGGYVGHWLTKDLFYEFLKIYMRATISEIVTT